MAHFRERFQEEIQNASNDLLEQILIIKSNFGDEAALQAIYDTLHAMEEASGVKEKITCSSGCSFCCHDEIIVGGLEAAKIKKLVPSLSPDREVLKKQQNASSFEELTWNEKRCSLLAADGSCTIYEDRPMICRTHNSEDDPNQCDQSEGEKFHKQIYALGIEALQVAALKIDINGITSLHKILS